MTLPRERTFSGLASRRPPFPRSEPRHGAPVPTDAVADDRCRGWPRTIESTRVFVLAVGALLAPEGFPEGKVVLCDLENLTTGNTFEDLPFLRKGAP
jgi:hypothetical protein